MPKLEYPVKFENGLVGVRCVEDIENREAYIFVPYKVMFVPEKVKEHTVLGDIVKAYPECFDPKVKGNDWCQLLLTLGLIYEVTLAEKSYWYPWIRQLPDATLPSSWNLSELEMVQNDMCVYQILEFDTSVKEMWKVFERVLIENP